MRRRLWVAGAVLVTLVLAVGGFVWWRGGDRTSFSWAVERAPSGTQRLSWTDWAAVRREVGVSTSADSPVSELNRMLTKGYDADLTSTSALVQSAPVLQEKFGFSPASADWELFSQSTQGAVVMIHLPDGTDFGGIGDDLESVGYTRPSSDTGVWLGGEDLMNSIGPDLTPELQYFALDAESGSPLASMTSSSSSEAPPSCSPSTASPR